MSYCLNPDCAAPKNGKEAEVCGGCGDRLSLQNRYIALKPLGQGGFGRTFLAADLGQSHRPICVIKQFLPQAQNAAHPEKATQLFRQEAKRLHALGTHAQIPDLYAYVEQDGRQYLIQEFIAGRNLEEILVEHGTCSEIEIRELLLSLLPVLQFIHDHQVIHRDIKPANIIRSDSAPVSSLSRSQGVKESGARSQESNSLPALPPSGHSPSLFLVDLGAAKHATGTAIAQTGTVIGSAEYTAPEQARGRAIFASDLYSLGVTCVHLLTGVSPFELYDTGEGHWVWRDYLPQPVSAELGQVLDKLLEPATRRRYAAASEVLADLEKSEREDRSSHPDAAEILLEPIATKEKPTAIPTAAIAAESPPESPPELAAQPAISEAWISASLPAWNDQPTLSDTRPPAFQAEPPTDAPIAPAAPATPAQRSDRSSSPTENAVKLTNFHYIAIALVGLTVLAGLTIAMQRPVRSPNEVPPTIQQPNTPPVGSTRDDSLHSFLVEASVRQLAFSADNQTLAMRTLDAPGQTLVWQLSTQKSVANLNNQFPVFQLEAGVTALPDVLTRETQQLKLVNPFSAQPEATIAGDFARQSLTPIVLSNNGKILLTTQQNDQPNDQQTTISAWDLATGRIINQFPTQVPPSNSDRHPWIFEFPAAVSPDGGQVAIARHSTAQINAIEIREIRTGNLLHTLRTDANAAMPARTVFSPDGKTVAVFAIVDNNNTDAVVEIWNLASDQRAVTLPLQPGWDTFRFLPDSRLIISHPTEGIQVWDTTSATRLQTIRDSVGAIAFTVSSDGYTLAWAKDSTIHIIDLRTGTQIKTLYGVPAPSDSLILTFSQDGKLLAAAAAQVGNTHDLIKVWNIF